MTRYWLIGLTILAAVVSTAVPAIAQDDGRLTVRFYSVQDLLTPRHGYRFNGHVLPGVDPAAEYRSEADGAFIGQGIVPNQPGGFFAVQDRVAAQAGDGRGVNGASLNMASTTAIAGVGNPHGIAIDDLMSVIARTVEPAQWETEGGSNVLDFLGGRLVVRATNDTHAAIEEFLKQLRLTTRHRVPVHIEAYWIKVDRSEAIGFPTTGAELEAVVRSPAIAGRVSCLNGQTVTICAGRRESVTTEVIAVVGDENAAYQPQTVYPNIGALLEVKPLLLENGKKSDRRHSQHGVRVGWKFDTAKARGHPA